MEIRTNIDYYVVVVKLFVNRSQTHTHINSVRNTFCTNKQKCEQFRIMCVCVCVCVDTIDYVNWGFSNVKKWREKTYTHTRAPEKIDGLHNIAQDKRMKWRKKNINTNTKHARVRMRVRSTPHQINRQTAYNIVTVVILSINKSRVNTVQTSGQKKE